MSDRCLTVVLAVVALAAAGCGTSARTATVVSTPVAPPVEPAPAPAPGHCHARTLSTGPTVPDPRCTPGALNPAAVRDPQHTICVPGYTSTIRPPTGYTGPLKISQIRQYGYRDANPASYEEDHLVALEDGGAPSDPRNLWPEPLAGAGGAHAKDRAENELHRRVCAGTLTVAQAARILEGDWTAP